MRIVLLMLLALRVEAATEYRMTIETSGWPAKRTSSTATVLVDGASRRVDNGNVSLLTSDGGKKITSIRHDLQTWWEHPSPAIASRALVFTTLQTYPTLEVRDLRVTASDEPTDETFAGYATHKYVVRATYSLDGSYDGAPLSAEQGFLAVLWTTDKLDPSLAFPAVDLRTTVAKVDAALAPKLAAVPGFPLKTVLIATRAYAGGRPQTETTTVTVTDVRAIDAPPGAFAMPRDYKNQPPPRIVAPGAQP